MANVQVTFDSDPNNARSESSLAINPNNPMQLVAASKKFNNIHTYDFTLATEYSHDGGASWHNSAPLQMPGFTVMTDPTLAWDDSGNVFLVGLTGVNPPTWNTIGIVVYKSTDAGMTWSAPLPIHNSSGDDKQWVAGDANPASPHRGNVYAVWDDTNTGQILFARTKDHGATWIGPGAGATPAGGAIITGSNFPEINVSDDGKVYVASISGATITLSVSTDGGDTFAATPDPATGITTLDAGLPHTDGFAHFPGGIFRVITDPTACVRGSQVLVAWADFREGTSRIYYALSNDGGNTWDTPSSGAPLLTVSLSSGLQHFHPQMVFDPSGAIGCSFYEFGPKPSTPLIDVVMAESFDGGATFNHFTVTDQPWDPAIDAPWSHGDSAVTFIGDYFGLDASAKGFFPLWTDTRTGIQSLFTAAVPERRCQFIINRSTLGQDEVDARRATAGGANAIIPDAFRVAVDGYSAAQLGIAGSSATLNVASPSIGMTISCLGNVAQNGDYGSEVQRFTFLYQIDFGSDAADPAFGFGGPTEFLTLNAAIADVSASAQIELIKQPDPFMLHGDPSWLSVDLRVFVMRANQAKFGVPMGADGSAAPDFIQKVAKALTAGGGSAAGQSFDDPAVLSPDEEQSALYLYPTDNAHQPVFNFALARVRYIGLIGATNVRVFFRLFQTQTTSGVYDYPPGHSYRRAPSNPDGQPIPLTGIQGNEYATMPFFALPRIDTTVLGMDQQTDSRIDSMLGVLGNVQTITAHGDGSEVDTYFGCWLDVNQSNPVIPAQLDTVHPDGPYQSASNPPLAVQQAMLRSLHHCLITEVAFDPIAIPVGKDPSNWDKLAQRNIAWSDVGSATAVTTFEIRPTPTGLLSGQVVDELMIDWGQTPGNSKAMIYLPAVSADEIIALASRFYVTHGLKRVDDHTVSCRTGGISYVPIPASGSDVNCAGLLTVDPPAPDWHGRPFSVTVRQVTNAYGQLVGSAKGTGELAAQPQQGGHGGPRYDSIEWRRVLGAFQLTVPVKPKQSLLLTEERHLALLKWVAEAVPVNSRWHPVFRRYLDVIAGRVKSFGGDPVRILPSPGGIVPHHADGGSGGSGGPSGRHEGRTGRIESLVFDSSGAFDGFILVNRHGEHRLFSREHGIEHVAERAWRERLWVTVWTEPGTDRVHSIALWTRRCWFLEFFQPWRRRP